jgi:tetratricopeptide (TPR) repeat protein
MADWYANADWSVDDRAEFFRRVKRARAKKAFIIRAKANYLFFADEPEKTAAAIELYAFGIRECPDTDLMTSLYLMTARCEERLGRTEEAIRSYRKVLQLESDPSRFVRITKAWSYFSLLIVREQLVGLYDEILSVLASAKVFLVEEKFVLRACRAIIFASRGDATGAARNASEALSLVDVQDSGLANCQSLGLVRPDVFEALTDQVKAISA